MQILNRQQCNKDKGLRKLLGSMNTYLVHDAVDRFIRNAKEYSLSKREHQYNIFLFFTGLDDRGLEAQQMSGGLYGHRSNSSASSSPPATSGSTGQTGLVVPQPINAAKGGQGAGHGQGASGNGGPGHIHHSHPSNGSSGRKYQCKMCPQVGKVGHYCSLFSVFCVIM